MVATCILCWYRTDPANTKYSNHDTHFLITYFIKNSLKSLEFICSYYLNAELSVKVGHTTLVTWPIENSFPASHTVKQYFLLWAHSVVLTNVGLQTSSPTFFAYSGSSVISTLSKIVPDFTCHKSKPTAQISSCLYNSGSGEYSGLSISG